MTDQLVQVIQTRQQEVLASRGPRADLEVVATNPAPTATTEDALTLQGNHRVGTKPFRATNFEQQRKKT